MISDLIVVNTSPRCDILTIEEYVSATDLYRRLKSVGTRIKIPSIKKESVFIVHQDCKRTLRHCNCDRNAGVCPFASSYDSCLELRLPTSEFGEPAVNEAPYLREGYRMNVLVNL